MTADVDTPQSQRGRVLIAALLSAVALAGASAVLGFAAGRAGTGPAGAEQESNADGAGTTSDGLLLPDLQTLPPEDLSIEADGEINERHLVFANTVWNAGEGPLELRDEPTSNAEGVGVSQRIYSAEGPPEDYFAGESAHHEEHDHIHFEGFAFYELLSLTAEGGLGSVVASGPKTTYCLMETTQLDRELSGRTRQGDYDTCGEEVQGISPGWGDTYGAGIEGQELNVEAVFDGRYALRSTADPDDSLLESDETNNAAIVYLEIEDDDVRVLDRPPGAAPRTENEGRRR